MKIDKKDKYLIVVAHPDDEVIGAGATIKKLSDLGCKVDLCIMCSDAQVRSFRPQDIELDSDIYNSAKIIGIDNIYKGVFPNIEMNNSTHLSLVQFIEKAIISSNPDIVITHHPADTNNDHMHTSLACQAAIRLFQRRPEVGNLLELWYMETLSATDWSINTAMNRFAPNTFVEIGQKGIDAKLSALSTYRGVMRDYPHPRSSTAIMGLASYRGGQSGCRYAEAFECVLRRII